jgi:hypothetical protein
MENNNLVVVRDPDTGELQTVCLDTGEVVSRESERRDLSKYKFNYETALLICQKVREGYTLKRLGEDPSLPSLPVIHYWQRTNESFREEMKLARKDRAEYYHDKVLDIADTTDSSEQVQVNRFKTDQYKWAAEKGNPERYAKHTNIDGSIENKVSMIVLNTGITRKKPDIEVTYEENQSIERPEQASVVDGSGVQSDVQEEETSEEVSEESRTDKN